MRRLLVCLILLGPFFLQSAVPVKMISSVPDNNQPPANAQAAYCLPMSAINIIEYWDVCKNRAGAYGLLGGLSGYTAANDIGWFCATNGNGSSSRDNFTWGLIGTLRQDIVPGLIEFFPWDIDQTYGYTASPVLANKLDSEWIVDIDYTQGFSHFRAEIDAGRPVIMCFSNWDISPLDTLTDASLAEPIYLYTWNIPPANTPRLEGAPEEFWYLDVKAEPGHAVTGIGYAEQYDPDGAGPAPFGDWVIVHDNWSCTPKTVAIPWRYWNATVRLDPGAYDIDMPFTPDSVVIDGVIYTEELDGCYDLQIPNSRSISCKAVKDQALYFAFTNTPPSVLTQLGFCFDIDNSDDPSPANGDLRIMVNSNGSFQVYSGSGGTWVQQASVSGLQCQISTSPFWTVELLIDYSALGLVAGQNDTLGFALWEHGQHEQGWPSASSEDVPASWGDLYSTDLFLPVSLTFFKASGQGQYVELQWQTASEQQNYGFEIQRFSGESDWRKIAFVNGAGTTTKMQTYSLTDRVQGQGEYIYRLIQIDTNGRRTLLDSVTVTIIKAEHFILSPNVPNPFNSGTRIQFILSEPALVNADIFSARGRLIYCIKAQFFTAGTHHLQWDGCDHRGRPVPSGVYFFRLNSKGFVRQQKMIVLR